ncbi:uncharacterized protein LOC129941904 [Eupeodes corollae]|uniref:uncharacterized protein LOC129941447 n=1 Tax=Eupeodes corollae TaxID=290404 RepID=UPI0024926FC3|nr:uncharacterized protein LOC129941447 [Eupeodes corollae]XP_055906649.1 uncharacterized protein LOC129941904 [Eupeodes corollae]
MIDYSKKFKVLQNIRKGGGLLNSLIDKLPLELHLPGYQFCGPGTNLKERLARGDSGINSLDQACKEHDISYSKFKNTSDRHIADKILAEKAWQRVKSKDASIAERASALLVTNLIKAKVKFGMGCSNSKIKTTKRKKSNMKSKKLSFKKLVKLIDDKLKKRTKSVCLEKTIKSAITSAKKNIGKNNNIKIPRIIPVPKIGGAIPFLIPLFAGLSALGALTGGAAGVAKAVNEISIAKKDLEEKQRHNLKMESIAVGHGLHLKPYKNGFGLYLQPQTKNF